MRFAVLGSGSKGNALVVQGGGATVLVDAGFAPRELKRRLQALDVELTEVRALLITHGHSDHIKGARALAGALGIPTWATDATRSFCARFGALHNHASIPGDGAFAVEGLRMQALATSHDAPGSVCFLVDDGDDRLGVCTDLGEAGATIADGLASCQALLLELNHDPEMLRTGPYPAHLKRRIASARGHLSNAQGAALLAAARRPHLTRVLLAHLSEVNNTPALALAAARPVMDGADAEVACAPQHHPTGWLRVRRARQSGAQLAERLAARVEVLPAEEAATAAPYAEAVLPGVAAKSPVAAAPTSAAVAAPDGRRHRALEAQLALFAPSTHTAPRRSR